MEHTGCSNFATGVRCDTDTSRPKYSLSAPRSSSIVRWVFPVIWLSLLVVSIVLRVDFEQRDVREFASRQSLILLPKGEFLKPIVLGHEQLAADLIWLEFVQVLGSDHVDEQDYEWIRHALDVVTTLDPQFVEAYDFGGVVLAELGTHVDWSNALLEKGMTANPQAWRLPFLLGFNHFFHLQDYGRAATFLSRAARLPGSPPYVPELAARLYVQADAHEVALVFLETMQREAQDAAIVTALERRRKEVLIERDLATMEKAIADHLAGYGALPPSLEQLVERGLLHSLPVEPFEGSYQYDPRSGLVLSTTHPQRLHMFGHGRKQQLANWSSLP